MNYVSQNIKFLRTQKRLSQQRFADILEISKSRVGSYEEGRSLPSIETLQVLSNFFKISMDILVGNDLSKATDTTFLEIGNNRILFPITVDDANENLIEVVPIKTTAGYLNGYDDPEYVEDLDKIKLPFLSTGKHRAFPIKGDSMLPMKSGTLVIGRFLESTDDITDGKTYIIITKDEGLVYKRVYNPIDNNETLRLVSDNKTYPEYDVKVSEVLEIWEFRCSIHMQEYSEEELKISSIVTTLNSLGHEFKALEKIIKQ